MRTMILALAFAAAAWAAPAADDEPTYSFTIELADVWGRSCVLEIEEALGRLEGVKQGQMGVDKFHYDIKVLETKKIFPVQIQAMAAKLQEYPYRGYVFTAITGKVEKAGDAYVFTARGSSQKFGLKANDAIKKLVGEGKSLVTLAGPASQEKDKDPVIQVTEAKEAAK